LEPYQDEEHNIDIEYGITRKMNSGNFFGCFFAEFTALFQGMLAKGAWFKKNKLLYIVMLQVGAIQVNIKLQS